MIHTPLHELPELQSLCSAGRLRKAHHRWELGNCHSTLTLDFQGDERLREKLVDRALVRVAGHRRGKTFVVERLEVVHRPTGPEPALSAKRNLSLGHALRARQNLNDRIRRFFAQQRFLEIQTQALVEAPGTDPHIEPLSAPLKDAHDGETTETAYLHTSPELSMKRLLAAGSGPIYQLCPVWRNGEVTDLHNPEFTMLEWYRPWQGVDAIMDDVERLVCELLDDHSDRPVQAPIPRMTMAEIVERACGFELLECLDTESLRRQVLARELLSNRAVEQAPWDEIFYSLTVTYLDPFIADQGALFVTHWPTPLAVLARRDEADPRVAERFELYIDGVELANGFGELTDAGEQKERFLADNQARRRMGLPELPMPTAFLEALQWGMPPSAGVALGVDRLLMLATAKAQRLSDVAPFALTRDDGQISWP